MGGWDRGLDYKALEKTIIAELEKRLAKLPATKAVRGVNNCCALLIQLRNGSRVGEAVEALKKFARSGERTVLVRTEKRKDGDERRIIIPSEVKREWINPAIVTKGAVSVFAQSIGINTHSLRYAYITKLAKDGVDPAIITKITHHKKMDQIVTYIQENVADEIQARVAK